MNTSLLLIGAGLGAFAAVGLLAYALARGGGRIAEHRRQPDKPGATLADALGDPDYLHDLPTRHDHRTD